MSRSQCIIYSDIDATFLDANSYSCAESLPAFRLALARGIKVVFCSSKTRAEILHLLAELQYSAPFIMENGGGLCIPEHCFPGDLVALPLEGTWRLKSFGVPYGQLVRALAEVREELGAELRGFADMSAQEVADACGYGVTEALRAQEREFDEPFMIVSGSDAPIARMGETFAARGLRLVRGGRFFHVTGHNDKGVAVRWLNELFRKQHGQIRTIGIGDSANDLPMLAAVDVPVLVAKAGLVYDEGIVKSLPSVALAGGIGPAGWSRSVRQIIQETSDRRE